MNSFTFALLSCLLSWKGAPAVLLQHRFWPLNTFYFNTFPIYFIKQEHFKKYASLKIHLDYSVKSTRPGPRAISLYCCFDQVIVMLCDAKNKWVPVERI